MKKEHQETLLQTIKANLTRNEQGDVSFYPDSQGSWDIVVIPDRSNTGLVKYFQPTYAVGVDKYGTQLPIDNTKSTKDGI